jgi:SdpC family antimicrobial peptide
LADLRRFESVFIAGLRTTDPAFLARFATDVQSGDYLVVQSAIDDAAAKLEVAARAYAPSRRDGNAIGMCDDVSVAIEILVIVAIVVAAVAVAGKGLSSGGGVVAPKSDDALKHDMLINAVVMHLATSGQPPR